MGAEDTTRKYLFRLADGALIESVLIPASPALYGEASDRRTLCVSTQVGCAYGCKFCASGLDGWSRNLGAGEIVGQILRVEALSGDATPVPQLPLGFGKVLMTELGLQPGPAVGQAVEAVKQAIIDGRLANRGSAKDYLAWLRNRAETDA